MNVESSVFVNVFYLVLLVIYVFYKLYHRKKTCMNKFSLGQSEFTNYHYEKDLQLSTKYLLTLSKTRWTAGNMETRFSK